MPEKAGHPNRPLCSVSVALIIGLMAAFAVQQLVIVRKGYEIYLALSGYGMKSWHLWELLTWQFIQCSPVQLGVNLIALWFVGRQVEARLGSGRFLLVYVAAGVIGGILQGGLASAGFVLPESLESFAAKLREHYGGMFAGASVGLCAIFAVFCTLPPISRLPPEKPGPLRLWPYIPLSGAAILSVYFLLRQKEAGLGLPHLAHLGGLLTGVAFAKPWRGRTRGKPIEVESCRDDC